MKYNSIRPGQVWLDTNGNRIQAHGGSIIYVDGVTTGMARTRRRPRAKTKSGTGGSAAMLPRTSITGKIKVLSFRRNPAILILP